MIKFRKVIAEFEVTDSVSKEVKNLVIGTIIQVFIAYDDSKGIEESKREIIHYKIADDQDNPCFTTWGGGIIVSQSDILLYTTEFHPDC